MTKYHACVWIDHKRAKIFELDAGSADAAPSGPLIHEFHAHANHASGLPKIDTSLLSRVADALAGAKAILILGPGNARTALAGHLHEHHPKLASSVWGMEASDHPTDAQIVARAKAFFARANRMHA